MDVYEKLSRALMRRKYERVGRSSSRNQGFEVTRKSVTVKIPKAAKRKNEQNASEPLPILVPKRFTILSSTNDVVDEAWLKEALRRTLAEGRLNILTKEYPQ